MKKIKDSQISLCSIIHSFRGDEQFLSWLTDEVLSEPLTKKYLIQRSGKLNQFAVVEKAKVKDFRQEVAKILESYRFSESERAAVQMNEEEMIPFERLASYFRKQLDMAEVYLRCEALAKFGEIKLFRKRNNFFLNLRDYHTCQRAIYLQLPEEKRAFFPESQQRYLEKVINL